MAVVVHGRLRAQRTSEEGEVVRREIGRGEPVGEIGVLTGDHRAADVIAIRDTDVLRVPRDAATQVLAAAPDVLGPLLRVMASRLRDPVLTPGRVTTVQLVPLGDVDLAGAVDALATGVTTIGGTAVVPGRSGVETPATPDDLKVLIDQADADGSVALLPDDGRAEWWQLACGRQADLVLLVGEGAHPTFPAPARQHLQALREAGVTPSRDLLLIHPSGTTLPSGTRRWLERVDVERHHHLRTSDDRHAERMARHFLGRSQGLVLSGGGARAMAHLGAYRAFREAGFPIDHVGGSSIGGLVSAQIAGEGDPEELVDLDRAEFQKANFGRRLTLPVVSLLSIRKAIPLFDSLFGDRDLADSWIPCFVTAVDFTECTLEIRDRGPAGMWTRATASPPGLWPPVVDDQGHVMVDGGVLDNLPVDPMRRRDVTRVASVNVSARRSLTVDAATGEIASWADYLKRTIQSRGAPAYPNIAGLLLRMGVVTSLSAQADAIRRSDLYVEPPVDQYGLSAYRAFDEIVDAGYRSAAEALEVAAGAPELEWSA
jgi:predicted acylesterase/phospholipase RssA